MFCRDRGRSAVRTRGTQSSIGGYEIDEKSYSGGILHLHGQYYDSVEQQSSDTFWLILRPFQKVFVLTLSLRPLQSLMSYRSTDACASATTAVTHVPSLLSTSDLKKNKRLEKLTTPTHPTNFSFPYATPHHPHPILHYISHVGLAYPVKVIIQKRCPAQAFNTRSLSAFPTSDARRSIKSEPILGLLAEHHFAQIWLPRRSAFARLELCCDFGDCSEQVGVC